MVSSAVDSARWMWHGLGTNVTQGSRFSVLGVTLLILIAGVYAFVGVEESLAMGVAHSMFDVLYGARYLAVTS